jgi:hypothetical protein
MEIGPGFRAVVVLVSCVLTTSGLARAQDSVSARQTEYLVTLGRLWATIKYFHPSIDESRPELWDNRCARGDPACPRR